LHPRRDLLSEHIAPQADGTLAPLTETGSFHLQRLRLNPPQLVTQRQPNRELQSLHERLAQLEAENKALRQHVPTVEEQIRLLLELTPRLFE
jgi:cell division protein FtsB